MTTPGANDSNAMPEGMALMRGIDTTDRKQDDYTRQSQCHRHETVTGY
jgi:hypothetical protein